MLHTTYPRFTPITPPPHPRSTVVERNNVSARPTNVRNKELPKVPNTLPYLVAFVAAAIASWGAFTIYATNKEKLGSSIFKSVLTQVKSSPEVLALLSSPSSSSSSSGSNRTAEWNDGSGVVLQRSTWLAGMPRVNGAVNMMQGRVDLSFQITTSSPTPNPNANSATVYFTSIRAHKHAPFEILRFVVVNDQGQSVSLLDKAGFSTIDVESGDIV